MKFLYFHLMPYPDLPDDFTERHRSVWVDIDPALLEPARVGTLYHEYLDSLEQAAGLGFDAVCVNEHHSNGYGMMPSPNLFAATLAREHLDAAICVMGNSIALYDPPVRVAEELAILDCLSGGRLIAGLPVGTAMDTCYAYGRNPSQLRERYHEAHDLIVRSWQADAPFAFAGRYNQLRYVNALPKPVQTPHPPIWIPGGGSVDTWQWTAERDYVFAYLSYFGYKAGAETMRQYWAQMDALGKDRNPYRAAFLQFVGVGADDAEARRLYAEPADYFFERCLHVHPGFTSPPGYLTEATIRAKVTSQMTAAAEAAGKATSVGTIDRGYVITGGPEHVADELRHIVTELNVGHLFLLLHFGNMTADLARYNARLFAEQVAPQLRGLFADWDDRWWPERAISPVSPVGSGVR